jgi:hypothetical protein
MRGILTLIFLGSFIYSNAQNFTKERDKFIKECQRAFVQIDQQTFTKEKLPKLVESAQFTESQFSKMVDMSNSIYSSSSNYSLVYLFVKASLYQSHNKFSGNFNSEWAKYIAEYQQKEEGKFEEFLNFSANLFEFHSIKSSDGFRWVFLKGDLSWKKEKSLNLVCDDGNLFCYMVSESGKYYDSIQVSSTSGVLDVDAGKFIGNAGILTWEKVGFDKKETFAELRRYKVDLSRAILKVDTVSLTTPYFPIPILGKLIDKTYSELMDGEEAPQFNSFEKRLKIKSLRENMDYDGGFSLEGKKFIGRGDDLRPAKVIFKVKEKPIFEVSSLNFSMDPAQIISREARLKLYYDNGDSLIHANCLFYFDEAKQLVTLTAKKSGSSVFPFEDFYFKVYVYAPVFCWKINSFQPYYSYEMGTAQEQKRIMIESFDYFDEGLFERMRGIGKINPISAIASYARSKNTTILSEGELASALNSTIESNKSVMLNLVSLGFLTYNSELKQVKPTTKLFNFSDAKSGKRDFDNLAFMADLRPRKLGDYSADQINSDPYLKELDIKNNAMNTRYMNQSYFAFIDINKQQLFITGTDNIAISNAQSTSIEPDSSIIIMKKNRDLQFKGLLLAGKFACIVNDAYFSYQDFKFILKDLDYSVLTVKPLRAEDGSEIIEMGSSFNKLKGELLIDQVSSKSGKGSDNTSYPKLLVPGNTKILYNSKEIANGAYDKDRFYYSLEPFELDSLDNFNEKSLSLKGQLISGGIFPPILQAVKIMPDYSFGFSTMAPDGGFPFYGNESKYENKILLSNNGLQGAGTINFMTATAISNKLTFLPDSTIGLAKFSNIGIENGQQVPSVSSETALICFVPAKQILKATSFKEFNLEMFDNQCQLAGTVTLTKKGMYGMGQMLFNDASLSSRRYDFSYNDIYSDTANFSLKNKYVSEGETPLAIETEGVKAHVSLKDRKGEFNSFGLKRIKFPSNLYYCTMDKFFWYMDGESVDFEKNNSKETAFEAGADILDPNFFSLDDRQDSLRFRSLNAKYDLKSQTIFCNKVEYVRVGDAKIFPDSMKIIIKKNAYMEPLKNAVVVANYITQFHKFYKVDLTITSRSKFEGNGTYPYYDRDSLLTNLNMKTIAYNKNNALTIAEGVVEKNDNFKLSKEFDYFGKIKIVANNQGILCDGSTRINHLCSNFDRSWLAFNDTVIAKNIQIPISEKPLNDKGNRLAVGFLWKDAERMDSVGVYPAFLSKIEGKNDAVIFQADGYVQYNSKALAYQIGTKQMLENANNSGNLLTLYTETCTLTGLGKIDLGIDLGEVKIESFGDISYEPENKKIALNLTSKFIFPLDKNIMEGLAKTLKELEGQKDIDIKSKSYNFKQVSKFWLTPEKENDFYKDYEEDKLRKLPEQLEATFLISGIHLEYFRFKTKINETGYVCGFHSKNSGTQIDDEGDEIKAKNKVAIIGLEDRVVLKELDFNMVFHQTNIDNSYQGFAFRWATANNKDYVLNYSMDKKDGNMLLYSKDETFMGSINEIKADKRKSKNFRFDIADETQLKLILAKFNDYMRIK